MTYSIVACDGEQLGVATASHWLAAGALVAWAQAGVGAVATQAFTEPAYGPRILARLRAGAGVAESLTAALADDDRAQLRQVAVVDAHGEAAHHNGVACFPHTAACQGRGAVAAGNMLATAEVPQRMFDAFAGASGDLAARLVDALAAGEAAGGDARGRQAAALRVVRAHGQWEAGSGVLVDLRVDDHPQPVAHLRGLLRQHAVYDMIASAAFPDAGGILGGDPAQAAARLEQLAAPATGEAQVEAALWLALCHLGAEQPDQADAVLERVPAVAALAHAWSRHLGGAGTH